MNNPEFSIYVGPMFSGKTSAMMLAYDRMRHSGKRCAIFKPHIDDRYDVKAVVTHSGWNIPATGITNGSDLLSKLAAMDEEPSIVAVDEAFMLDGIADVLIWMFRSGISVIVSTLDLSYSGKTFSEVNAMLPWATEIHKCKAACTVCGEDANFTYMKQFVNDDSDQVKVGGAEMYEPRCFTHHPIINKRP